MPPGDFSIDNITLFKSVLTPQGPVYEKLFEKKLGQDTESIPRKKT